MKGNCKFLLNVYSSFHFLYTPVSLPHWDPLPTRKTPTKSCPTEKVPLKSVPTGNNSVSIENCCDLTMAKFEGRVLSSPLEFDLNFSFPTRNCQKF